MSLEAIAASTVKDEASRPHFNPYEHRSLLIVFYGDKADLQLWRLRISPSDPAAERIHGMTIQGAVGNRARFFDRYFRQLPPIPIETLTFLAAHIVLTAGHVDPVMIHGLDVAQFDRAGYRLLDEKQKTLLRERSDNLDALIRKQFFAESP